jgi:hypothetical protein
MKGGFLLACLIAAAPMLAGCSDDAVGLATPDQADLGEYCDGPMPEGGSRETLLIELDGQDYDVRIPFLVSAAGTDFSAWVAGLSGKGDAEVSFDHESGHWVRLQGSGAAYLAGCVQQDAAAHDAFANATWSGGDPEEFGARVTTGTVTILYSYWAESEHCDRTVRIEGQFSATAGEAERTGESNCSH